MDLSTMSQKVEKFEYRSLSELRQDVELIIENCNTYNEPDSEVASLGKKLKDQASKILKKAAQSLDGLGIDYRTGQASGQEEVSIPFSPDSIIDPPKMPYYETLKYVNAELNSLEKIQNASYRTKKQKILQKEKNTFEKKRADMINKIRNFGSDSEEVSTEDLIEKFKAKKGLTVENNIAKIKEDGENDSKLKREVKLPNELFTEAISPIIAAHVSRREKDAALMKENGGLDFSQQAVHDVKSVLEPETTDLSLAYCVWLANKRPAIIHRNETTGEPCEPECVPKMNGHFNGNGVSHKNGMNGHDISVDKDNEYSHRNNGIHNGLNGYSDDKIFVKYMTAGSNWFEYDSSKVLAIVGMHPATDKKILEESGDKVRDEYKHAIKYLVENDLFVPF